MENASQRARPTTVAPPTPAHARRIAKIALNDAGLAINPNKLDFFAQRMGRLLRASGASGFDEYLATVEAGNKTGERRKLIEALTTHTTDFFREPQHYDFLLQNGFGLLEELGAGRTRVLRMWSAACSNGAELYSAMICAKEYMTKAGRTLRLEGVGTDLSQQILTRAAHAVYNDVEISGLSEERRLRHLLRDKTGKPRYRIEPELRHLCRWAVLNLTDTTPEVPREVDVAFLRNVLIYFDRETQSRVVQNVSNTLSNGGFLLTGHSEALSAPPDCLQQIAPSTYQKLVG